MERWISIDVNISDDSEEGGKICKLLDRTPEHLGILGTMLLLLFSVLQSRSDKSLVIT
jgi:hypothetical protein